VTYAENQVADAVVGTLSGSDLDGVTKYEFKHSDGDVRGKPSGGRGSGYLVRQRSGWRDQIRVQTQ
ncbi:hypothetical protein AB4511_17350, partial [Vibrio sp. 10N.222.54.F6]|uniref:hypothetical protein n=1 Tax=Vibrio sp. 10N.222.54.F6 TaxID=3229645 RepID=UPI00354F3025